MTEQEQRAIELIIRKLEQIAADLAAQKRDLEVRIEEIDRQRDTLVRLMPTEKRIEHLF